jgi:hypothetical protein
MLFKTLIAAIEDIIKADVAANALIKVYNRYTILPGIHTMPAIVIGTTHNVRLSESFVGQSAGSRPRLWEASIGISCLTRNYPLQAQVIAASESIDAVQNAVFHALNQDSKQGGACVQSWVENIREVTFAGGEYHGFEIQLQLQVYETSD